MTYVISLGALALMIGLDQLTKYLAVTHLLPIGEYQLIDGVFRLSFVENRGMAFGLLAGGRWVFILLTVLVLGAVVYYYIKLPKTRSTLLTRMALTVVCAGALGNFIDRVRQGYVVDFFYFHWFEFPVFNVADIFVVCGTISLCVLIILGDVADKKKGKAAKEANANADTD